MHRFAFWVTSALWIVFSSVAITQSPVQAPRFEILVLGTHHAPCMFQSLMYTPAHIRATLKLAKPDVIAVEMNPGWLGKARFSGQLYEAETVAVPFARERGIPVHGVDCQDTESVDRMMEYYALDVAEQVKNALASGKHVPLVEFGELPPFLRDSDLARTRAHWALDWLTINDVQRSEYGSSPHEGSSPDNEYAPQARDRGIIANIIEVMQKYPGKRVVVVIGAAHKPVLDLFFSQRKGIRVLKLGRDVPVPTAAQIDQSLTSQDLVTCLGHNLDSAPAYFHEELVNTEYTEWLLKRLEATGNRLDAVRYFRARINMIAGRFGAALKDLDALIASGADGDIYPYPMDEWRMRYRLSEATRIEKARVLLVQKKNDQADQLLGQIGVALDLRLRELEKTRPRELRHVECVRDAGFESRTEGSDDFDRSLGWYSAVPRGRGKIRRVFDQATRVQGKQSWCIEIVEPCPKGHGFQIGQEVELPPTTRPGQRLTIGLAVRGQGIEYVRLDIRGLYDGGRVVSTEVSMKPNRWSRLEATFGVPKFLDFHLGVWFAGKAGAKLWLDDATPLSLAYNTIPREWSLLALAREFPRSVLSRRK